MNQYLGSIFEDSCVECLWILSKTGEIPYLINKIGKWWGNNPILKRQEEIDIVAISETKMIFGECKFRNEPVDLDVLKTLEMRSQRVHANERYYYIFSKSGFTKRAKAYSEAHEKMEVLTLDDMELILKN